MIKIKMNWVKLTGTRIGVAAFAAALALALPAQADEKLSQADFVRDCNTDTSADFGDGFSGDGVVGKVTVPSGRSLEIFNFGGGTGQITVDCMVVLSGDDSELNLAEGTDLLFQAAGGGAYTNFTVTGNGAGSEIELQVKKDSIIEAHNLTINVVGVEEAEAQFEENFCLRLHGDLMLTMNTGTDEGGDVQFKKFEEDKVDVIFNDGTTACGDNINVDGDITLMVGGKDSEIQIEEDNHLKAGGSIKLTGKGEGSQVQTKKGVMLTAGDDITLEAPDFKGEVQAEESNDFAAGDNILISSAV